MFFKLFILSLSSFLVIYLLRGLSFLGFLPGGVLVLLLLVALITSLGWGIQKTTRF